jgi:small subunit ribosomal protein S5
MVEKGEITTMSDALKTRLPLREPEIVDILLPDLADEVLDVNMVQRMTDSGRRVRFAVSCVVGNSNGYVGLGKAKGKEVGPTIRKAIDNAKLNIIEVRRGCGSWECGCGKPHSFPFEVTGKMGSVCVTFKPAPNGIALAVGDVAKPVLKLAGIKDAWAFTKGHTKTTSNYATAAFEALKKTSEMRVSASQREKMHILTGMDPKLVHEEPKEVVDEKPKARIDEKPKAKVDEKSKAKVDEKPKAKVDEKPKAKVDEKSKAKSEAEKKEPIIEKKEEPKEKKAEEPPKEGDKK